MEDKSLFLASTDPSTLSEAGFVDEERAALYTTLAGEIGNISIGVFNGRQGQEDAENIYVKCCTSEAEMLERPFDKTTDEECRQRFRKHLVAGKYLVVVTVEKPKEIGHQNLNQLENSIKRLAQSVEDERKKKPAKTESTYGGKTIITVHPDWENLGQNLVRQAPQQLQ